MCIRDRDRELLVKKIKERLCDKEDDNWTLIATSCVEAGVDFSFRNGVREAAGLVNLLQLAGRIRRNEEDCYNCLLYTSIKLRKTLRACAECFYVANPGSRGLKSMFFIWNIVR